MPSCVQDTLVSIHSALRFPANQLAPGPGTLVVLASPSVWKLGQGMPWDKHAVNPQPFGVCF